MSELCVIELGGKTYSSHLQANAIELKYIPEDRSPEASINVVELFDSAVTTILLHIQPNVSSNRSPLGIQFIKQQNIGILNRANTYNLLYMWIGFQNSIDLIYFELPDTVKSTKVESIGHSALSFEYSNKQFGNLSSIQVLDSALGRSTFVGFHLIKATKSETFVSIVPVDAYVAVYEAEKIRSRNHSASRVTGHVAETVDLSTVQHLSLTLKDTSETRSLIDPRTLRHWCPHMILHSSEDGHSQGSSHKYSLQQILSASSFSFAAIAQTKNMAQQVKTYVTIQQKFIDTVLAFTAKNNHNDDDGLKIFSHVNDSIHKFYENSENELVVYSPCSVDNNYLTALQSRANEACAWQYCLALKIIPTDRQQVLIESYFSKSGIPSVDHNYNWKELLTPVSVKSVDQSFPRTVIFEALVTVDRWYLISQYIRSHSSNGNESSAVHPLSMFLGNGQNQRYRLEDVGRVHEWAVEYKSYLDTSARRMTQEVFAPLLLNKAVSTELLSANAGELVDMPLPPLVRLTSLQTATRAVVDILKSLRKRKIATFIPTKTTNSNSRFASTTTSATKEGLSAAAAAASAEEGYEMDFIYEEHKAFVAELSGNILQLETIASMLHFYSISCYSNEIGVLVSLKSLLVSPDHEPMYPLSKHMSGKYDCLSDKGYLYVTPPELVLRQTVYDLLVERVCVQASTPQSSLSGAMDSSHEQVAQLREYCMQRFQSPFLAQQQQGQQSQEEALSNWLLLSVDLSTRLQGLLPTAPLLSTDASLARSRMGPTTASTAASKLPSHIQINNNNDYIDISLVHSTHQLLLYTILDACYLSLEAAYGSKEISAHSSSTTATAAASPQSHTDNDDDLDGPHDYDDDHSKLHKAHKKQLLIQLTNVVNTLGAALQLNVVQINFLFSLWKLDNNVDVVYAASELCRLVYHLEDDAQLFEVIVQRLLSVNNDNCCKAVQRLIHYFVNNEKSVGRLLVEGSVTASEFICTSPNPSLMDNRVGFSVLALAASYRNSIAYVNGWHMSRRLCADMCRYSSFDKSQVRRKVALMLCKWCALSGYLKEFLEQGMDSDEASEVESYLEDLAMRDVTAARDPSSTVQLVCTWLMRHRHFDKAKEIHELHKAAVLQAVESGGRSRGINALSSETEERQRILDAYTLIPQVSEQYFRTAEPRSAAYPSLLDPTQGLDAYVPSAMSPCHSPAGTHRTVAHDKGLSDVAASLNQIDLNVSQLPALDPWFSNAFRVDGQNVRWENNESHLMKSARKQDVSTSNS